jgi:tetratricopeptide (TPR) repeat protein
MHRIRISTIVAALLLGLLHASSQTPDWAAAADRYQALAKANPADVGARVNLGVALVHLGRYQEALQQYEAAERLLPADPRILVNIALAYQKSGDIEQASKRLLELHTSYPADTKITLLLADCDLQLGKDESVVELLEPMRAGNTDDLGFAYMLGTALIRQHRIEEGQVYLDKILRNGDSPEARFLLGTRMFESGDYPAAVQQLSGAAQLKSDLPLLQSYYGRALLATGDADGALAAFRKELVTNPCDEAANLGLGEILVERRECSEAIPHLERVLERQPRSAAAHLAIGRCFLELRDLPGARTHLEAAVQNAPDNLQAHRYLLTAYELIGATSPAKVERERVRKLEAAARQNEPGPKINEAAPEFALPDASSGTLVRLSDVRQRSGAVLVFGSYSCPNFRDAAADLKRLQAQYGSQLPFLLVYIREAHATGQWQSTRNERDSVTLRPATNMDEKREHATVCRRQLHLSFQAVVDGMDGSVEAAYQAWPSRLFVIDKSGRIRYSTRLTEQDFHPEEVKQAIHDLSASSVNRS